MVFSSGIFLFIYLPTVLLIYYLLDKRFQNVFLTLASLFFYAWGEPRYVMIMLMSIVINYLMGLLINGVKERGRGTIVRRVVLLLTIVLNLGFLFYFKYLNFFFLTINSVFSSNIGLKEIALPIGISFFTFQGMSYTLDLYMGKVEVQKNPLNIALYISLFPQLIAGPIVRYKDINDQISDRVVNIDKFAEGIMRFIIGLSKKVIIANQLGLIADEIFGVLPSQNLMSTAWLGVICYTFQIYFDFSGYSDMAIGLGKMFGFDFLENFNYPYISKSITEFWRRWHISLSTWFRDYVYIPLGGNRRGNVYINTFVVFMITGLWHGASWNFVLWGFWHGMFLIIEKAMKKKGIVWNTPSIFKWCYCMFIVLIGWVLFRCETLTLAVEYIGVMFGMRRISNIGFAFGWYFSPKIFLILVIAVLASIPWNEMISMKKIINSDTGRLIIKYSCGIVLLLISIILIMASSYNPFIYFRF